MMHNTEVYITVISFIIYSNLHYHVLVRECDGKGIAGR